MVKVRIIKDSEGNEYEQYIGQIFEAFVDKCKYPSGEFRNGYCVNFGDKIFYTPKEFCEEVEWVDNKTNKSCVNNRVLLVEDGSVDVNYIEDELGIKCIVYRQGANKPEWLEIGE